MFRLSVSAALIVAATSFAEPAYAGPPANHACLGADSSATAQALQDSGSSLGAVVSRIAPQAPQAVGVEVQAHLAGQIPDEVFPNTCND